MRLLDTDSLEFTEFRDRERPPYAIASHRWHEDEITYQEVRGGHGKHKQGYKKVEGFARYVRENVRSVKWLWIDTCCINKENAAELSKAINLMFDWYRDAEICIAYLADVRTAHVETHFLNSEWFKRGWTLQELLAPKTVVFVTELWQVIGNKGASFCKYSGTSVGLGLESCIAAKIAISEQVLHDYNASRTVSVDTKLKWMEGRTTSEEEDMSYALYGIFGVTLGANYGEKYEGARKRLLAAIQQQDDRTTRHKAYLRTISGWLSPPNPWTNHETARQRHENHTGSWLLQSEQYQKWTRGIVRNIWIHGKAGCGKTILCSTAIEDIRARCNQKPNSGYAVFYFSFSDTRKQSVEDFILSLVEQIGWNEPGFSMLQEAYERPSRSPPRLSDLQGILLASIKSYDELFLIADALDECPEHDDIRQRVLEFLAELSQRAPNLRILAASRESGELRASIEALGAVSVAVANNPVDADIRTYVEAQLLRDPRLSRLDITTKAQIGQIVSTKADGMFRWAYCQLQELKKLKSMRPKFINEALNSLPATLDETYERILMGIDELSREDALALLRWLAYARNPPTLAELVDATIVNPADGTVDVADRGSLEDTLHILAGLISTVRAADDAFTQDTNNARLRILNPSANSSEDSHVPISKDTRIRLAHFSVKEYLESTHILKSNARHFYLRVGRDHGYLAQSCLTYLMHYSKSKERSSTDRDLDIFPLLQYASQSWFYHSSLQEDPDFAYVASFLSRESFMQDWLLLHQPDRWMDLPFQTSSDVGSGLYYASVLGLDRAVSMLLGAGADVNAQGGNYGTPLQAASRRGHEKTVRILVEAGADVNAQDGAYGQALQAAAKGGYEKIARILIDAGANVNAQGGGYGNALQAASRDGHEKAVQTLIAAGAEVNAQGGAYGHSLQAAAKGDYYRVVQLLLDAGADVDAQGGHYGYALQAASKEGHEKVVQMLTDAGAKGLN